MKEFKDKESFFYKHVFNFSLENHKGVNPEYLVNEAIDFFTKLSNLCDAYYCSNERIFGNFNPSFKIDFDKLPLFGFKIIILLKSDERIRSKNASFVIGKNTDGLK